MTATQPVISGCSDHRNAPTATAGALCGRVRVHAEQAGREFRVRRVQRNGGSLTLEETANGGAGGGVEPFAADYGGAIGTVGATGAGSASLGRTADSIGHDGRRAGAAIHAVRAEAARPGAVPCEDRYA